MKILTLWQPWGTFVVQQWKKYETRSWSTSYRGEIAIHAAKRKVDCSSPPGNQFCDAVTNWHYGCILAIAELTACLQMVDVEAERIADPNLVISIPSQSAQERRLGDWQKGQYAWKLENVQALLEPIPYRGGQGLRNLDPEAETLIRRQLGVELAGHGTDPTKIQLSLPLEV